MAIEREELRQAVQVMMNDVIEQSFMYMEQMPGQSEVLNGIIKEAGDELSLQLLRIDAHRHAPDSAEIEEHYMEINREVHRKSLVLLSRLQSIEKKEKV